MPESLLREIRKLEVRLEAFLKEEEIFVDELKKSLDRFKELNKHLEKSKTRVNPENVKELLNLRLKAVEALSDALEKQSEAEHEKSHLLESYGALILVLDKAFKGILNKPIS